MSKDLKRPAIVMPTADEDRAITAAAKGDPDAQPLTPQQLKAMVPMVTLRGRPKSENKKLLVSVRYSSEVVASCVTTSPAIHLGEGEWPFDVFGGVISRKSPLRH
jgi:uncharacterized protein (DUF4415 family)